MVKLRHNHIVQFYGFCASPPTILMEYCSRGSLADVLHKGLLSPLIAQRLTWRRRLGMVGPPLFLESCLVPPHRCAPAPVPLQ